MSKTMDCRATMSKITLAILLPCLAITLTAVIALVAGSSTHVAAATEMTPAGEQPGSPAIAGFFMPPVKAWNAQIETWAAGYGLDPNLVATVMQIESCGNPNALSRAGAEGLFQVMPFHFEAGEDMTDPGTNSRRGLEYLSASLLQAEGNVASTFAGYNAGLSVIHTDPTTWPRETQRYAYWGSGIYADAQSGSAVSPRLNEWLQAGGSSLCAQTTGG